MEVSAGTVVSLMKQNRYSHQRNRKMKEASDSGSHRDEQFQIISRKTEEFEKTEEPSSRLTLTKEIIGYFKACGSLLRPVEKLLEVIDHDFATLRATPYGLYDIQRNTGFVNLSTSADTSEFALESIRRMWVLT